MTEERELQLEELRRLLHTEDRPRLREYFAPLHPFDAAELVGCLENEERGRLFQLLDDEVLGWLFSEFDPETFPVIVSQLGTHRVSRILEDIPSDDAVDLLGELPEEQTQELLDQMRQDEAEDVKALMTYAVETAGGLMTDDFITLRGFWTVQQALGRLREMAPGAETIYYLYVTDIEDRLVGVVSIRQLIVAAPETRIEDIMGENVISIEAGADQEEAAHLIEKYDFLALPVVDQEHHLLGIVTVDDVIDVLEDEATEDISRLAAIHGITESGDLRESSWKAARRRLPWLILLMGVGLVAGNIISRFESTLEAVVSLAVFIPLMADMAGNTGTQALVVVVRGLSIGEFRAQDMLWLLRREAGVGLFIGTVNGLLIAAAAWFWQGNPWLGFVIGFSLWLTLMVATMAGAITPLALHRVGIDPAVASGPFITTINDIIGLTIYFSVATYFMHHLVSG